MDNCVILQHIPPFFKHKKPNTVLHKFFYALREINLACVASHVCTTAFDCH